MSFTYTNTRKDLLLFYAIELLRMIYILTFCPEQNALIENKNKHTVVFSVDGRSKK